VGLGIDSYSGRPTYSVEPLVEKRGNSRGQQRILLQETEGIVMNYSLGGGWYNYYNY
jgi:hypothetical protein